MKFINKHCCICRLSNVINGCISLKLFFCQAQSHTVLEVTAISKDTEKPKDALPS